MFGMCVVRTVLNVSRIFFNLLISEIQNLKQSLERSGVDIYGSFRFGINSLNERDARDKYLFFFSRIQISQLYFTTKPGIYVFCAKITDILHQTPCWSIDSRTIKDDLIDSDFDLNLDSPDIIPRYNINVKVRDGVDVTYLSLCDADVEGIVNIHEKQLLCHWRILTQWPYLKY